MPLAPQWKTHHQNASTNRFPSRDWKIPARWEWEHSAWQRGSRDFTQVS
jgi:hypothetical protein